MCHHAQLLDYGYLFIITIYYYINKQTMFIYLFCGAENQTLGRLGKLSTIEL
jgi:hypothetical protein